MKKILYIIGAILLMAGCTKTELENEQGVGSQEVMLSVSPDFTYGDGTIEPMTRATVSVNNYVLELYSEDTYTTKLDTKTSADGSFTLTLDRTKDYYALLWADNDNTIYNTADLKAVTLKADKKPIEAFFGKTTISGKSSTINVSLKRAVAKIQLCDKNGMEAGKSVNLKYSHLPTFNTATGAVSGTAVAEDYDITSVAAAAGKPFGDFWMLAPATASSKFDLTFKVAGEAEATTVADITYQANHRTNVKGQYVVPKFRVGDYYYSDNTFSTAYNSSKECIGVIFWKDPTDATKGKIVSLQEPPANWNGGANDAGCLKWSTEGVGTNAIDEDNGLACMREIIKISDWQTKYPAFAYADAQNGTNASYDNGSSVWYLPAKDELVNLYNWWNGGAGDENVSARAANNTIITTAEGTEFDIYFYWSATELNTNDAWIVLFNFDITFTTTKTNSNRVRLVRDIVVP